MKIEGERYSDVAKLKVKIAAIEKLNHSPEFHIRVQDKNTPFETVGAAILLLQKAGAPLIVRVPHGTEKRLAW